MDQNEIEEMLDHLGRIKIGGDLDSFKIDQIEKLEMDLRLLRTFIKYHHVPDYTVILTKTATMMVEMLRWDFVGIPNLNLEKLESPLLAFTKDKCYVKHEKLEYLETQLQFIANNVVQFCLAVLVDDAESEDDIFNKPPYLLCLIVLVKLEMKKIFEKMGVQVKYHTDPYYLPFLTTEESCKLLHKKGFQTEDCPLKLQGVSQRIAEKCKGLPLVAVLVAGIIKKRKMEESWWNKVKDGLFHYLDPESEAYNRATMQLSFDNLSDCLKPCLLYMGMFREDSRI
ncbi:hypothetical protein FXO38_00974 [Capsicum annuum]|nr:hypothetical protein FXO38_00974 [Capsicum annuum]